MSYYIDISSQFIWTLLYTGQALSYHFVCVSHNMLWGRNWPQHQQWNYRHSHLIATSAVQLSFPVFYNLPVFSRQEQDPANLCPFLTLRPCLHQRTWWRSCSTAAPFATLRVEEWKTRQWLALCVQSVFWRVELLNFIQWFVHTI